MTVLNLTDHINTTFHTDFKSYQIKYKVDIFFEQTYGLAEDDAYRFISLAKEQIKADKAGFFDFEQDINKKFLRAIFISKTMIQYSKFFLDIVLVDSTYRRNRFNLPLINVLGINNAGQNILLAFGLLNNETASTFDWFFKKLKQAWDKNPDTIITDDSEALQKGKFEFSFFLFFFFF